MARWLLQCNPAKWRIFDFFEAGNDLAWWSVNRYLAQPTKGDDFALWLSGPNGGVVGLGKVTGRAVRLDPDDVDDGYWTYNIDPEAIQWQLPIELVDEFLKTPVPRVELAADARFADALILKQPRDGNPFPLTDLQWAAIVDRRQQPRVVSADLPQWSLIPGDTIRRTELHVRYGGSGQGGISPSRTSPNVLIFTDPKSGIQHGYYDEWAEDGTFRYAGQGQHGDQEFTAGNAAIRDHAIDGRALRLFEGVGGVVRYAGEFLLDPVEPFSYVRAHASGGGEDRSVIQFHLRRRVEGAPDEAVAQSTGTAYRPQDAGGRVALQTPTVPADPDAYGRGLRHHRRLQNQLAELARKAGLEALSPSAADPDFDLAWATGEGEFTVVEVKSVTDTNEIRQLRMGLGQVLDYGSVLQRRGLTVRPALYMQRQPADDRWIELADQVGVSFAWPGAETRLGLPTPENP